jgi:hypothetical protein
VVELGCGTGLSGLALAAMAQPAPRLVCLTDADAFALSLARANAEANAEANAQAATSSCAQPSATEAAGAAGAAGVAADGRSGADGGSAAERSGGRVSVRELRWGDATAIADARALATPQQRAPGAPGAGAGAGGYDMVVASDAIYDADVVGPLLSTAEALLRPAATTPASSADSTLEPLEERLFLLAYAPRCAEADKDVRRRIERAAEAATVDANGDGNGATSVRWQWLEATDILAEPCEEEPEEDGSSSSSSSSSSSLARDIARALRGVEGAAMFLAAFRFGSG